VVKNRQQSRGNSHGGNNKRETRSVRETPSHFVDIHFVQTLLHCIVTVEDGGISQYHMLLLMADKLHITVV